MESRNQMPSIEKGTLINEGKTKKIYEAVGEPGRAIVEYKNDITAFDDPTKTRQFDKKAQYSNTTNARVFEMLNRAGIPTAFVKQLSGTEFLAEKCTMVPLEVVARRYAVGSYVGRHPEYQREGKVPHRFDDLKIEFFLKTTKGKLKSADGAMLVDGLDPLKGEEDPFIANPDEAVWKLMHSKKQETDPEADLERTVESGKLLPNAETIRDMEGALRKAFETLEQFFDTCGFHFVDIKIEFGITSDGRLVIADVIDNDSWRLRDQEWRDVSKQSFRDGEDMATIEDKYAIVANLLEKSRQA